MPTPARTPAMREREARADTLAESARLTSAGSVLGAVYRTENRAAITAAKNELRSKDPQPSASPADIARRVEWERLHARSPILGAHYRLLHAEAIRRAQNAK